MTKEYSVDELEKMLSEKKSKDKQIKNNETKELKLRNKLGYSERLVKNILLFCFSIVLFATIYSFYFRSDNVWGYTLDVVKYAIPATVGFFIWKAKSENVIKIKDNPSFNLQEYAQQIYEDFRNDTFHNN